MKIHIINLPYNTPFSIDFLLVVVFFCAESQRRSFVQYNAQGFVPKSGSEGCCVHKE